MTAKPPSPLILAIQDRYEEIEWEKLTQKDIQEEDPKGKTLLHYAATDGYWSFVPPSLKDKKYWTTTLEGDTIYMRALIHGRNEKQGVWIRLDELVQEDILAVNKSGENIAEDAARRGYFKYFSKEVMTTRVLTCHANPPKRHDLIIHLLARSGQFDCIPREILTEELLSLKGNYGENLYHILSGERQIHLIPEKLLTIQAMTSQSDTGVTPLHRMAAHRHALIPEEITLDDLLLKTVKGVTVLHSWAGSSGWINIPNEFLTRETLELKDGYGTTPIDNIIENYSNGWASRPPGAASTMNKKMKSVLKKLSDGKLQELKTIPCLQVLVEDQLLKRKLINGVSEEIVEI
jgi:hypothetical protein